MGRPATFARIVAAAAVCMAAAGGQAAPPPPPFDEWTVDRAVDGTLQQIGNRAIDVHSTGEAWIAYGGDVLRVAHGGTGGFAVETVDPQPGTGANANLRLDAAGVPHVAYVDRIRAEIRYAKRAGGTWTIETIGQYAALECTASFPTTVSLELDAAGSPRVAYRDLLRPALVLATRNGGGSWSTEVIDTAASGECSIAIDAAGKTHACYGRPGGLWHAAQRSGGWDQEVVQDETTGDAEGGGSIGASPSTVVDSAGNVHVTYADSHFFGCCNYQGRYATNASGTWVSRQHGVYRADWTSLAISSGDVLHFASNGYSFEAFYDARSLDLSPVGDDFVDATLNRVAVAVAPDGTPRLVAVPDAVAPLQHLVKSGTTWTRTGVGEPGRVRTNCDLVFDAAGRPVLTSLDLPGEVARLEGGSWLRSQFATDALRGAIVRRGVAADLHGAHLRTLTTTTQEALLATLASGTWSSVSLGVIQGPAFQASLVDVLVKQSGDVLVFHDHAPTNYAELRCFLKQGAAVTNELIDLGVRNEGYGPDSDFPLAVSLEGPDGRAHVVYQSLWADGARDSAAEVRHAVRDPGGWTVETIAAAGEYVSELRAAFDSAGKLHVCYFTSDYASMNELKYTTNAGGSWAAETLAAPTQYSDFTGAAIAVAGGAVHVLHGSNTSGLTGSQRGTGGPTTRVVDANRAAVRPQLVTDAAGRLHLAYARSDLQEIWYGTFAPGESWQTVSVDDGGIGNPSFRTETIRLTQGATSVAVPVGLTRIGGPSGFGFGFALDDGDVPHVGTALASLNDLRYASPGRRPDALLGMVDFATMDGTDGDAARAGQDYTAVSGTFTWMLGQGGGRSFDVPLIPDPARVGDHAFKVTLTNQQGFERLGACPELDIVVRNVPVGTLVSYFLPRSVNFSVNSAAPEKSRLVASGFFDMGLATTDLSGAATLFVGTKVFVLPALERRKNGSYRYAGQGVDFTITPNKSGSSRAKFRLSTTGDLTGRVSADGLLTLRFIQAGVVDGTGSVGLQAGRYKLGKVRGTLTAPALFVYSAKATVNGGGRDTLTLKTGLGALGGTPPTAPDVTVAFGSFTATVPGAEFTPRGESFVFKGDVGGVTSLVMDYARETMTLSAKGIDLGTVPEGAQSVIVTVGAGGSRTVLVRVVRKGNALRY